MFVIYVSVDYKGGGSSKSFEGPGGRGSFGLADLSPRELISLDIEAPLGNNLN